jgi:hypothetical protein
MTTVHRTNPKARAVQRLVARTLFTAAAGIVVVGIAMPTAHAAPAYIPLPTPQSTGLFNIDPVPAPPV